MTPDEAREHLAWPEGKDHPKVRDGDGQTWFEVQAGESHPYWNRLPDAPYEDVVMYAAAKAALAMIAGMHEEWGVHVTGYPKNIADWAELCDSPEDHITWLPDEEAAADFAVEREDDGYTARIVSRYVTEQEEA